MDEQENVPAPVADTRVMLTLENASSVSVDGREYMLEDDGSVLVPAGAAIHLCAEGLAVVVDEEHPAPTSRRRRAQ